MDELKRPTRRHFTDAARAAAAEARRLKREAAVPLDVLEVFIVRLPSERLTYGWEIRRFGAIVVEKGGTAHSTLPLALAAGEEALASFPATA